MASALWADEFFDQNWKGHFIFLRRFALVVYYICHLRSDQHLAESLDDRPNNKTALVQVQGIIGEFYWTKKRPEIRAPGFGNPSTFADLVSRGGIISRALNLFPLALFPQHVALLK